MTKKFIVLSLAIVLIRIVSIIIQNLLAVDVENVIENYQLLSRSSLVIYLASIAVPLLYILFLKKLKVLKEFSIGLIVYYSVVQVPIFTIYSIASQNSAIAQSTIWSVLLILINVIAIVGLIAFMVRLKSIRYIDQTLYIILLMFIVGVIIQNPMPAFFIKNPTFASYYYVLVSGFTFVVLYCSVVIVYLHERMNNDET